MAYRPNPLQSHSRRSAEHCVRGHGPSCCLREARKLHFSEDTVGWATLVNLFVLNSIIKRVMEADNSWACQILVGAPTGSTATRFRGQTIHKMLNLKALTRHQNRRLAWLIAATAHSHRWTSCPWSRPSCFVALMIDSKL